MVTLIEFWQNPQGCLEKYRETPLKVAEGWVWTCGPLHCSTILYRLQSTFSKFELFSVFLILVDEICVAVGWGDEQVLKVLVNLD